MEPSEIRNIINLLEGKEEKLILSPLPYDMGDLSPVLSKDNVDYHYNVLSKGYVDRYNKKEGDPKFNYGGAMLHNLFWTQLRKPAGANNPVGSIKSLIEDKHKDYKTFKEHVIQQAMTIQGSGWVYLSKKGEIKTTPNQSYKTDILMPIDMWEHSFTDYVPAKDAKKKYIAGIMRLINWDIIKPKDVIMAFLVHNLPPVHVLVRKEYLYDLEKGHGEYTEGIWISVKSIQGKAFYFETLLPEYGALFDKLPISAFVWKKEHGNLPLDNLQLWDCFDYNLTVIKKPLLSMCEYYGKDKEMHSGEYLFTIDTCHSESSTLDTNFSEHDPEHKTFNVIKLDNGQFAAQPNNRIIWRDQSLISDKLIQPDFKVCTQNYNVETTPKWSVGHTENWQYKTEDEEKDNT